MKFWNKVKQLIWKSLYKSARIDVLNFMFEAGPFRIDFPKNLKRGEERLAYKQNLTAVYTYQEGDDLLAKKQDFIDQYTVNEREQFDFFITRSLVDSDDEIKTRVWRDHEQVERGEAQKAWRKVICRNHREHMRQKFMNQKTR